ncbi:hypothetical protein C8J57DRAFT_1236725 [Mycena rebaudengoi]|nr:hypothetical protein C8J57DRAFT_1236725 [Mycena rebaudengoi]
MLAQSDSWSPARFLRRGSGRSAGGGGVVVAGVGGLGAQRWGSPLGARCEKRWHARDKNTRVGGYTWWTTRQEPPVDWFFGGLGPSDAWAKRRGGGAGAGHYAEDDGRDGSWVGVEEVDVENMRGAGDTEMAEDAMTGVRLTDRQTGKNKITMSRRDSAAQRLLRLRRGHRTGRRGLDAGGLSSQHTKKNTYPRRTNPAYSPPARLVRVLPHVPEPVLERAPRGYVVHRKAAGGAAVLRARDAAEGLRVRLVPALQLDDRTVRRERNEFGPGFDAELGGRSVSDVSDIVVERASIAGAGSVEAGCVGRSSKRSESE